MPRKKVKCNDVQYTRSAQAPKITTTPDTDVESNLEGLYKSVWLAVGALSEMSFDDIEVAMQISHCRRASIDFNIDWNDVVGPSRLRHLVDFRRLCTYHLRSNGWTYKQIGIFLGNRDHATCIHSHHSAEHLLQYDRTFRQLHRKFQAS